MAISTHGKESRSFWARYHAELLGRLHGADERRSVDSMEGRGSLQARPVPITCKASEPVANSCRHFLGMHVPPSSECHVRVAGVQSSAPKLKKLARSSKASGLHRRRVMDG